MLGTFLVFLFVCIIGGIVFGGIIGIAKGSKDVKKEKENNNKKDNAF